MVTVAYQLRYKHVILVTKNQEIGWSSNPRETSVGKLVQ